MLVYGDAARTLDPRAALDALRRRLDGLEAAGAPIERHARLVALFIDAGELTQGLADAVMAAQGGDGADPVQDAAMAALMILAHAVLVSWSALADGAEPPAPDRAAVAAALATLEAMVLPAEVRLKSGEGYAYYALYPEAYAEAARGLREADRAQVIGVRSIGAGLAAIVSAALQTDPPVTVRPLGHPFQRRLQLTPALQAALRAGADGRFVVVDEGPGLSGSSFGATADALESLGAKQERIAFLPGHGGDLGTQASDAHRARWRTAERPCVDVDALILRTARPGHRLQSWFRDIAPDQTSLEDISGGAWRRLRFQDEAQWPAANTHQERRKLLLHTPRRAWLLKFAGLGRAGERTFDHALRLGRAGFAPEPAALRHGFMAEPWIGEAAMAPRSETDHRAFAAHLGRYLGWRAAHLPAPNEAGAGLAALLHMTRVNTGEALGEAAAGSRRLDPGRWADAPSVRRVWTDNRLHAHEWLQRPDGGWLKTDAVDHAAAHDLIGAQDIAWDVAGALVEFDLDTVELAILVERLADAASVEPALVELMRPAYLAFQLAAFTLAATAHAGWPQEQARLAREAARYRRRLEAALE